ncbi:lytic transglycosylase domain-containing protein [Streptomyces netropsis]|uniref:lytic transglycosylase domain-containing protein n=1 Tax=Streptomyces netropsis TaxID=55404 RepID=UPI0030CAC133
MVESAHALGHGLRADGATEKPLLGPRLTGGKYARIKDTDGGNWDGDKEFDRAVGPMQFLPSTWKAFAADGNADGAKDLNNIFDAGAAASRYLCAGGGNLRNPGDLNRALLSYNYSPLYVRSVLGWTRAYQSGDAPALPRFMPDPPLATRISQQHPPAAPHTAKPLLREAPKSKVLRVKPEPAQHPDHSAVGEEIHDDHALPGTRPGGPHRLTYQGRDKASETMAPSTPADTAQHCTYRQAPEPAATPNDLALAPDEGTRQGSSLRHVPSEAADREAHDCTVGGEALRGPEPAAEPPGQEGSSEALSECSEPAGKAHSRERAQALVSATCAASSAQ